MNQRNGPVELFSAVERANCKLVEYKSRDEELQEAADWLFLAASKTFKGQLEKIQFFQIQKRLPMYWEYRWEKDLQNEACNSELS